MCPGSWLLSNPTLHAWLNTETLPQVSAPSDTVGVLRELVGPADPEVARLLRPQSLRALFGSDKVRSPSTALCFRSGCCSIAASTLLHWQVRNAVHCTDLVEDGPLEAHYFFRILQ